MEPVSRWARRNLTWRRFHCDPATGMSTHAMMPAAPRRAANNAVAVLYVVARERLRILIAHYDMVIHSIWNIRTVQDLICKYDVTWASAACLHQCLLACKLRHAAYVMSICPTPSARLLKPVQFFSTTRCTSQRARLWPALPRINGGTGHVLVDYRRALDPPG